MNGSYRANQKCREKAEADNKLAQCSDESFAEASFYIGLIHWQQGNYESGAGDAAAACGGPQTDERLQHARCDRRPGIACREEERRQIGRALLNEGIDLLKKAAESAPDESNVRFNYAIALFLMGNYAEAAAAICVR